MRLLLSLILGGEGLVFAWLAAFVFVFWGLGWGLGWVGCLLRVLAFPCFVIGLLASPLCGAALTFFAAAKKVSKESGLTPPARSETSLFLNRKRPKTRSSLAPPNPVTKHSSTPRAHSVRPGTVHHEKPRGANRSPVSWFSSLAVSG
jgi:hypothetical protein